MSGGPPVARAEAAEALRLLREGCARLRGNPADYPLQYSMWDALKRIHKWDDAVVALKATLRRYGYGASPPGRKAVLGRVALVAVDCSDPDLALHAMQMSLARCVFREALLLTDRSLSARSVRVSQIPGRIDSTESYSRFMVKSLLHAVDADYVLVTQWDGFVADAARWSEQFLNFDYLGARWPHHTDAHSVGNGGFSLRSRKLLEALQDPEVRELHPEDFAICRTYRPYLERQHSIQFAPPEIADRFAFEYDISSTRTFGFHGMIHLPRFVEEPRVKTLAFLEPLVERWSDELL
jgi:hypothetical protein